MANHFLDYISKTAIEKAIAEVEKETGVIITFAQAEAIIKSQSAGIREAMENKDTAKIMYLGKFLIKPGREELIDASKQAAKDGISTEERKIIFKAIAAEFKRKRELKIE